MGNQIVDGISFSFELVSFPHMVISGLHDYYIFHGKVESLFSEEDEILQAHITDRLTSVPEKKHPDFIECYASDLHQNQYMFPSMHRESIFITIYNFLEHHITEFCVRFGDELNSKIKLEDLKGNGVEKALTFLKKVAGFDFSKIDSEIGFIRNSNRLRNIVVHNGGYLKSNVSEFISKNEHLSGATDEQVCFKEGFISEYIKILEVFFEELYKNLQCNAKKSIL